AGYFAIPAVASHVGGIPEVVEHEKTGLLVPPDDPLSLAAAIDRLISNPTHRRELGVAAKERMKRLFSVERMAADFQETYEQLTLLSRDRLGWLGTAANLNPYLHLLHVA